MTSWPEARRLAHATAAVRPGVTVTLAEAAGRTLAEDLHARSPLPPFDAAAMDGWGVRGPAPWTVVGRVLAGDPPRPALADGQAVEVATGAVVPDGCEGVVPYEAGPLATAAHPAGRHVRRVGEECPAGDRLLCKGTVLSSAAIGLVAATGHDHVLVSPQPRVRCLVTGSELVQVGLPPAGRIRDAVGPLLVPALRGYGASPTQVRPLADDRDVLLAALSQGDVELVITSGASSSGPADHLAGVLAELGAEVLVDGVAVKPGHPQLLARLPGGGLLVGLPGNPLAALAGLVTLVEPALCGLLGRPLSTLGCAVLGEDVAAHPTSHRLVPVVLEQGRATPTGHAGAAMLRGAATAAALAVVPPGVDGVAGTPVQTLPLP